MKRCKYFHKALYNFRWKYGLKKIVSCNWKFIKIIYRMIRPLCHPISPITNTSVYGCNYIMKSLINEYFLAHSLAEIPVTVGEKYQTSLSMEWEKQGITFKCHQTFTCSSGQREKGILSIVSDSQIRNELTLEFGL